MTSSADTNWPPLPWADANWPPADQSGRVQPIGRPCPRCQCCMEALCSQAADHGTTCAAEVTTTCDFDLTVCPCRPAPAVTR